MLDDSLYFLLSACTRLRSPRAGSLGSTRSRGCLRTGGPVRNPRTRAASNAHHACSRRSDYMSSTERTVSVLGHPRGSFCRVQRRPLRPCRGRAPHIQTRSIRIDRAGQGLVRGHAPGLPAVPPRRAGLAAALGLGCLLRRRVRVAVPAEPGADRPGLRCAAPPPLHTRLQPPQGTPTCNTQGAARPRRLRTPSAAAPVH